MTLKKVARTITISLTLLVTVAAAFAQNEPAKPAEANYEVVLNVLIAGGQTGEAPPPSLSTVSRQIRSEFGFSNLRLINTYLGRVANRGNIEYKGVSNAYAPESMPGFPSFLDWRMTGLRNTQNAAGQPAYQLHGFRFGARVPVRAGAASGCEGPGSDQL